MKKELSIVIPSWKQSERLPKSLMILCDYLTETKKERESEIIIVLEDSEDKERTREGIIRCQNHFKNISIRIIDNDKHYGKGYTVKKGVLEAKGKFILMTDADFSTPIHELKKMLALIKTNNLDCVIGKRIQVVKQPFYRRIMGITFRKLTQIITKIPFEDTQCGFKLFTNEFGHRIFSEITIDGFGFDIELLALGLKHGYRIEDIQVEWYNDSQSTVNPIIDSYKMFKNLFYVKKRIREIGEKK